VVSVGDHVTIQENDFPPETYQVVGAREADPRNGRIFKRVSHWSAIMDHKVGDIVEADTPGGRMKFKILKIE